MGAIASQITSPTIVYSTVYSDADQRKHQSSASLAFVGGIHRGPVNSPHKWPVTRKMFPFDDVIMFYSRWCRASGFIIFIDCDVQLIQWLHIFSTVSGNEEFNKVLLKRFFEVIFSNFKGFFCSTIYSLYLSAKTNPTGVMCVFTSRVYVCFAMKL